MAYLEHLRGGKRCALVGTLLRCSVARTRRGLSNHWPAPLFFCLVFVLQIVSTRDATAAPPTYRVGACLSARDMPPLLKGETPKQYYQRTISELENIADAIKQKVPKGVVMDVVPILLAKAPTMPSPRDCLQSNNLKSQYDIWLVLTYKENATFVYDVFQRDGQDLELIETNPEPLPDAARTRLLLAEAGARIVAKSWQSTATPVQVIRNVSRGIIFLYDSSGSMRETDPGAQNRLGVGPRIGELVAHVAQPGDPPIPFAVVVFADSAEALESKDGSRWFETTPADLQIARTRLGSMFKDKDIGNTNIGAAFDQVAQLISSRKDIEHWHVVFLTDGEPTAGITDYGKIEELVKAKLGGKSTLSVIALYGNDPSHTQQAKLKNLVSATLDGSGHSGEIVGMKMGDNLVTVGSSIDKIASLISQSTVRDEAVLTCTQVAGAQKMECELDQSRPHALRFGAAQKVTFIVDMAAFPGGKCTVTIGNQGLGQEPLTVDLPAGESGATLTDPSFTIALHRSSDRVFLMIDMKKGRLNGDWQIKLTAEAAAGGHP